MNIEVWENIDWHKVERYVFKLQKQIFKASRQGNIKKVRQLQKTLLRSWSNRLLAVRRISQDNRGKKTAGVDGVKSLTPIARIKLAKQLRIKGKSKATLRVWIPKPGKDEKRPLGIPTEKVVLDGKKVIEEWLSKIGLELKPSKTRITHTLLSR